MEAFLQINTFMEVGSAHRISQTLSLQRFLLFPQPLSEPDSSTKPQKNSSDRGIWFGLHCGTAALCNEGGSGAVDYRQEQLAKATTASLHCSFLYRIAASEYN